MGVNGVGNADTALYEGNGCADVGRPITPGGSRTFVDVRRREIVKSCASECGGARGLNTYA